MVWYSKGIPSLNGSAVIAVMSTKVKKPLKSARHVNIHRLITNSFAKIIDGPCRDYYRNIRRRGAA